MSSIGTPSSTPTARHLTSCTRNSSTRSWGHRSRYSKYTWEDPASHRSRTCQWCLGVEISRFCWDSRSFGWQLLWRRRWAEDIRRGPGWSNPAYLRGRLWCAWSLNLCWVFPSSRSNRFYGKTSIVFYNAFPLPLGCTFNGTECISTRACL